MQVRTENIPFTMKLWYCLRVRSYPFVKATDSSSFSFAWAFKSAVQVKASPLRSHIKPSVAVRFFSPCSFFTSSSSVAEWAGAASYLARTFWRDFLQCIDLSSKSRTYDDITLQIGLDGSKSSRSKNIWRSLLSLSFRVNQHMPIPNRPRTPWEASRKARVSTPASVTGTSAKD